MAYDLEEQEQIETLKSWWKQYGTLVLLGVVACLVTIAAIQGWRYYRAQQAERASVLFNQLEQAEAANDSKKVRDIAVQIIDKHGSSQYAAMASLAAAKASFATGELESARKNLQWAMENARDKEMRDVARLRLAGILLDEKKYDEALKLVSTEPTPAYAPLYADRRGDILAAQGKAQEARAAYQSALEKLDTRSQYRALVEMKLDATGAAQ
jgi:predicted negative regulator of RcsB-dependent stress response